MARKELLAEHECARFTKFGFECPFKPFEEEPDDDDREQEVAHRRAAGEDEGAGEDDIDSFAFDRNKKGRGRADKPTAENLDNVTSIFKNVTTPKEARRHGEGIAALQREGALKSIPNMSSLLQERGPKAIIALLTSFAVAEGLRRSGAINSMSNSRAVRATERVVGSRLSSLSRTSTGRGSGRGFFHNDAEALRGMMGMGSRRREELGSSNLGSNSMGMPI